MTTNFQPTETGNPGTSAAAETERVRRIWEKLAPRYDSDISFYEKVLFAGGREWVCSRAVGDVLEIGVGTGRNLEHYPQGVRVTGIDFSPPMLVIAQRRAAALERPADLRLGDAQALEFPADRFDTVVCTLTLCSIPDEAKAVWEAKRVLRPGGRLLLLEHVGSPVLPVRAVQTVLDWVTVRTEGDHMVREPLIHLTAADFEIEHVERHKWGIVELVVARKRPPVQRTPS